MKKFYVIGNPIKHSLSPKIFNYWFDKYKLDHKYEKKLIKRKGFKTIFKKTMLDKDCGGANITLPFKQNINSLVSSFDSHAKKIGAINCVYKRKNKTIGTNTDWEGYLNSLKKNKNYKKIKKQKVGIIGFGGATKAVIYALKKLKFEEIIVFIRNKNKLRDVKEYDKNIKAKNLKEINKLAPNFDLLINTTSTKSLKDLKIDMSKLKKTTFVSDINYSPHKTKFLKLAIKNKKSVIYGIYMLIYQAAPSFKLWFGFYPKIDDGLIDVLLKKNKK